MSKPKTTKPILVALVLLSSVAGYTIIRQSRAAVSGALELEAATVTGSAPTGSDAAASGGQYLTLTPAQTGACSGTQVSAGGDIQAAINAAASGATICVAAGTYRIETPLTPKTNQKLIGAPGAILNGSKVLTGWAPSGSNFVATAFPTTAQQGHGDCSTPGCSLTQDIYFDNQYLTRVTSLAALGPSKFYQDSSSGGKVYLRDNPTGHTIEQAVANAIIRSSTATGVTVRGFVIEKAANRAQDGAINADNQPSSAWLIENNEVRYNHGVGVFATGASNVRFNKIHHQGEEGVGGDWNSGIWEGNEVYENQIAGYNFLWEGGGSKWAFADGLTIRANYFHDNNGPGIWTDINNKNVTHENNVSVRNEQTGIFHEISQNATIRNNIAMDNTYKLPGPYSFYSGSQILVSASRDVEVYGNKTRGWGGIGLLQQDRPEYPDPSGPHHVQNAYVHDNDIHQTEDQPVAGGVTDTGDMGIFTSRNNRFQNNHYHTTTGLPYWFDWLDAERNWTAWRGYGHDANGTLDTSVDTAPAPVPTIGDAPVGSATATGTVDIATGGTYRVWVRMMAPDAKNDSATLQIDNGAPMTMGDKAVTPNTWTWIDYQVAGGFKATASLGVGSHTVKFTARETGVKIDRLIFSANAACVPTGNGSNCLTGGTVTKPADLNNDGAVNIFDLSILLSNYGRTGAGLAGDLNADNIVNIFDLSSLLSAWGT